MVIIDGLVRIQNAQRLGHHTAKLRKSKFMCNVLDVLRKEGYIYGFRVREVDIVVYLKRPVYKLRFKFYSKPSYRRHIGYSELRRMYKRRRVLIVVSTVFGILSVRELIARNLEMGGCLLFEVDLYR